MSSPAPLPPASAPDTGVPWGTWLRGAAFVAFLLAMAWVALRVEIPELDVVRARIEAAGAWGWVIFVAAYTLVAVTPIPVTILSLAGGVVFGMLEGSILSVLGAVLGAVLAFGLARVLGSDVVLRLLGRHGPTVERWLSGGGFDAVFTLRVIPGIPYWPVNYGAGALGVGLRPFLAGSVLSTVPGQLVLVGAGALLAQPRWSVAIAVALCALAQILLSLRGLRRWRATVREEDAQAPA